MIVSASYRTDIPAFYGRWFARRLAAGFCDVRNPWSGTVSRVALGVDRVSGFVFWTRHPAPFVTVLDQLRDRGSPFVVQFTITGYPRALEPGVADWRRAVAEAHEIAARFGPRVLVWRYDPVMITDLTPAAFHVEQMGMLAGQLSGATDEVVLSFAHIYAKSRRSLDRLAARRGIGWSDPPDAGKAGLLRELGGIAGARGMAATVCAQADLTEPPLTAAACIDPVRLADVHGAPVTARRKGNRPGCLCAESRDIGAYDSCNQGCVYCYAVRSRDTARRRMRQRDPDQPLLLPQPSAGSSSSASVSGGALATPTMAARNRRSPIR